MERLLSVEQETELDNSKYQDDEQRQDEGELHNSRSTLLGSSF
jgi:hypothetical protein